MAFTRDKNRRVKENSGGSYINKTGLYPVTIKKVWIEEKGFAIHPVSKENEARSYNAIVEYNGTENRLYPLFNLFNPYFKNDAIIKENKIRQENGEELLDEYLDADVDRVVYPLMHFADLDDLEGVETKLPIGENKALRDVELIEGFTDLEVILYVDISYSKGKNGVVYENKTIYGVFDPITKASLGEIESQDSDNPRELGKRYKDLVGREFEPFRLKKSKDPKTQVTLAEVNAKRSGKESKNVSANEISKPKTKFGSKFKR